MTEEMDDKFIDFYARASKWGGAEVEYTFMEELEHYISGLEEEITSLKARLNSIPGLQDGYKYGLD